jgi:hypothetical protein
MNETELRERLLDLAGDAPSRPVAPARLLRRARRRVVLTIAASVAVAILVLAAGIAGLRALQASRSVPADHSVTPPDSTFGQVHGWIAFRDGEELVAVDPADPTVSVPLGNSLGADPIAWSRDGTRLLLRPHPEIALEFHGGEWWVGTAPTASPLELFVLDQDATITQITHGDRKSASGTWGSFSPDGTQVAYACCGSSRGPFVVDADGGKARRLGEPCERTDIQGGRTVELCGEPLSEWANWSPDGTQIAWIDFVEDSDTYGHHAWTLSFVRPDGTGLRTEVVQLPGGAGGLVWSPDGAQLAFWMVVPDPGADPTVAGLGEGGDFPAQIFVINADGSGLRQLTEDGDNRWPTWSPDGSRIAFTRGELSFKTAPDGSQAAFVRPGTRQLFTIALDGGDLRRVDGVMPDGPIAWNPVR